MDKSNVHFFKTAGSAYKLSEPILQRMCRYFAGCTQVTDVWFVYAYGQVSGKRELARERVQGTHH
jgi:hypothetical protein